jgi:hypothetical protein
MMQQHQHEPGRAKLEEKKDGVVVVVVVFCPMVVPLFPATASRAALALDRETTFAT